MPYMYASHAPLFIRAPQRLRQLMHQLLVQLMRVE